MPPLISCPRAGRWFRGCRFEARYDEVDTGYSIKTTGPVTVPRAMFVLQKYIRDVCTRCGATIERTRGND